MVLGFLISSAKSIIIFFVLYVVSFFILFKINTGVYKYYYNRNLNLELKVQGTFLKINDIFKPVFRKSSIDVNPMYVSAEINFFRNLQFIFRNNKYEFIKK